MSSGPHVAQGQVGSATCAIHNQPSHRVCERCGAFICAECVAGHSNDTSCAKCREVAAAVESRRSAQRYGILSWALPGGTYIATVVASRLAHSAMFGCLSLITAPFGLWCAVQSRKLARRGIAPFASTHATIGLMVNGALLTLFVAGLFLGFVVGRRVPSR